MRSACGGTSPSLATTTTTHIALLTRLLIPLVCFGLPMLWLLPVMIRDTPLAMILTEKAEWGELHARALVEQVNAALRRAVGAAQIAPQLLTSLLGRGLSVVSAIVELAHNGLAARCLCAERGAGRKLLQTINDSFAGATAATAEQQGSSADSGELSRA